MAAWGLSGAFLLGFVAGLRTFTAPAALLLARVAGPASPWRRPRWATGWFFAAGAGVPPAAGAALDAAGALLGAYGGRAARQVAIDGIGATPAALLEDLVAVGLAIYAVARPV